jgi:DNA polymerase I-like protein with 3'-5' exonuclease and polymerase domains
VGYDASGLEARVEAHYTKGYPGGEAYAYDLIEGDIHTNTAVKMFSDKLAHLKPEEIHKEHPDVKPLRNKAKTLKYAASYGASAKKIASTLGVSQAEGEAIFQAFWDAAAPLATLRDRLTQHWEQNGKTKIRGLDKRWIMTRMKHALVNSAQQSAGAVIFQYATLFMHKWLNGLVVDNDNVLAYNFKSRFVYPVAEMHDEALWEVPKELADEFRELGERSLTEAGKYLKVKVPILGEGKVGDTWASVH